MPKTDYSKCVMYKIVCNDLSITDCYVGHTTNFIKRKNSHKSCCFNQNSKEYNLKQYLFIRENGGWDNFSMIEIEKYPCNDGNEARARERYWFETLNANLNFEVPNRSFKEYVSIWLEENKDKNNEIKKKYRNTHKEEIAEYQKLNHEKLISYWKEYRIKNKAIIAEKDKQRRLKRKTEIET
jgi:hypothetical protein